MSTEISNSERSFNYICGNAKVPRSFHFDTLQRAEASAEQYWRGEFMIQQMPDLFHLISPNFKNQSVLSLFTTYFLFPLMITMGVLANEIVMPNGLGATLVLFLVVSICCLFQAVGLSFLKQLMTEKVRAALYILMGAITPFAVWYGFTLTI